MAPTLPTLQNCDRAKVRSAQVPSQKCAECMSPATTVATGLVHEVMASAATSRRVIWPPGPSITMTIPAMFGFASAASMVRMSQSVSQA